MSWAIGVGGARVVWDVVPSSKVIKCVFGTFASNRTYVGCVGLLVFCACPFAAGCRRPARFFGRCEMPELKVSTSVGKGKRLEKFS